VASVLHLTEVAASLAASADDAAAASAVVVAAAASSAHAVATGANEAGGGNGLLAAARSSPGPVALLAYCALASGLLGLLLAYHVFLVSTNQTTYENVRAEWAFKPNPFDSGLLANWADAFRCTCSCGAQRAEYAAAAASESRLTDGEGMPMVQRGGGFDSQEGPASPQKEARDIECGRADSESKLLASPRSHGDNGGDEAPLGSPSSRSPSPPVSSVYGSAVEAGEDERGGVELARKQDKDRLLP